MDIFAIGTGHTKFGVLKDSSDDLIYYAAKEALDNANIEFVDCDAVIVANFSSQFLKQSHTPARVASLFSKSEITRVESACASGALAVKEAIIYIKSGLYKTVLVVGFEKMSTVTTDEASGILMQAASKEEYDLGLTFPSLFALMARAHFEKYKSSERDLAKIAVKNHKNAFNNELAHFHKNISVDDVLNSKPIAPPIKLLDSSPISDGAAAIVLTSRKDKSRLKSKILSFGHVTEGIELTKRTELYKMPAVALAAKKAYEGAGILPRDISFAEVHDCFTIAELIQIEELGFSRAGEGKKLISNGSIEISGKIPINASGGLKAKGHPIGATGVSQIVEVVRQFEGKAKKRQLKNVKYGLTCNIGGIGSTALVTILANP